MSYGPDISINSTLPASKDAARGMMEMRQELALLEAWEPHQLIAFGLRVRVGELP